MNYKTRKMFAVSLAASFSISLVSMGDMPQAIADKDKHNDKQKKLKFDKKPSFVSEDCIITDFKAIVHPDFDRPSEDFIEELDCEMKAWLDKKGAGLKYKIKISGMELIDSNTAYGFDGSFDDIDGIHIHKMNQDADVANPMGPHVLDTSGNPQFGDSDVVVKPAQGIVKGVWDDGDRPYTLSENLDLLCNGRIFTAIHGEEEDRKDHKAPYMKMVLEPTKQGKKICDKLE